MQVFPINSEENKRRALRAVWGAMGQDGVEVVIRKRVESGSKEQQAWLNMLCKMIADEIGDSPDAVKAAVKVEVFGYQDAVIAGRKVQFIPRSDWKGMPGFSQLIERAYVIGANLGIVLPDPEPKRVKRRG